jgi:outer membrane protein TolC
VLLDAQIVAADAALSGGGDSMGAAEARAMHAEVARMRLMADREIISNGTAMMRVMLGLPGDAALPPPADDLGEPDLASIPDEAELLDLSRRRPEVMAAEARLRAAEARRADAEANGLPNWEAMAGWSTMEDSQDMRFTVGVGVQIPVQRAPRQAQRIAAGEMVNAARSAVEAAMSEADRDVLVAAARLREHAAAVRLLRDEELPATQAAVDAARAAQASGKANLVDVIQAERRRLTAEQRLLFEKHEYFHWMGELECCIGMSLVDLSRPSSAINEK